MKDAEISSLSSSFWLCSVGWWQWLTWQSSYSEEIGDMPYVNIRITKEGATSEQKAKLIEGATKLVVDVLGKNPQTTFVIIDEVDTDNWGIAGESVTIRRRKGK